MSEFRAENDETSVAEEVADRIFVAGAFECGGGISSVIGRN